MIRPKIVVLFTSYRCNARCVMCYAWKKQVRYKELTPQDVKQIFSDKILRETIEIINLTGGEPTLRNELTEIIEVLASTCIRLKRIDISTNGINTDEVIDQVERALAVLVHTGVALTVSVSVDGVGDIHDGVRGIRGAFKNIDKTLNELKEMLVLYPTFSVGMNFTVNKNNYMHLYDAYAYSRQKELGMSFTLSALSEIGVESLQVRQGFELPVESKEKILEFIGFLSKENRLNTRYERFLSHWLKTGKRKGPCSFKKEQSLLCEPDGAMYLCGNFKEFFIGNVLQRDFSELSRERRDFSRDYAKRCSQCNSNCYIDHG